jgi:nitrite reductase/ring-hydroxylating ferredoxin subunit
MVDVGSVSDFDEGRLTLVRVHGREIAVVKWRGEFFAIAARCPHMSASFSAGVVSARLVSGCTIGSIEIDEETPMVGCPWHGWQFDLRTGQSAWDKKYSIRAYHAECQGERVCVSLDHRRDDSTQRAISR